MQAKSCILITGAGSGIGRAIALTLGKQHPDLPLILTGRSQKNLAETLSMLSENTNHETFPLDVTQIDSIKKLKEQLIEKSISLKGLVLNAGIGGENRYGAEDRWDDIMNTNLKGPYCVTQELLPLIKNDRNEFKNIVFISSILARLGVPQYTAYCSSKAGLLGLMRSLAAEHSSSKILVNAICPGWVETKMSVEGLKGISASSGKSFDAVTKEQMAMVPLQKMSQPHEVAELVNFLINGNQCSITGQTLDINNGAIMP